MPDATTLDEIDLDAITDMAEKAKIIAEATDRKESDVLADLLDDGIANFSAGSDKKDGLDFLDKAQEQAEKLKKLLTTLIPIVVLLGGVGAEGIGILDITGWGEESIWDDDNMKHGCTNIDAANYDSQADIDDGSCYWDDNNGGGGGPPDCEHDWQYEDHSRLEDTTIVVDQILGDNAGCDDWTEGVFEIILKKNGQEYRLETTPSPLWRHSYMVEHEFENVEAGTYRLHVMYLPDGGEEIINQDVPTFTIEEEDCVPNPSMNHLDLSADGDDLILEVRMEDYEDCGFDMEIELTLFHNGESYDEIPYEDNAPHPYISAQGETTFNYAHHDMNDMMDGDWRVDFQFRVVNNPHSEFESDIASSNTVTIDEIPDLEPCAISVDNMAAALDGDDAEQDAITISFYLAVDEDTDCTDDVKITYKLEDGETVMQHQVTTTMADGQFEYTFDNVPVGSWHPIVRIDDENGYELEGNDVGNVEVEEPPRCDITLYDIYFANDGNTTAGVWYDLDCGDGGGDDGEGFNVSIQFDIKIHNTTELLDYNVTLHFIEGYVEDVHELLLHDIANGTYCFNWVAIWTDEDGQQHIITQTWENIVMAGPQGDD